MEEVQSLIGVPGMTIVLRLSPYAAAAIWLLVTVSLWRNGFTDLTERLTRPRWAGAERARAVMMMPLRALMLTLAAGIGAAMTTIGILFNAAVILNILNVLRTGAGG